MGDEQSGSWEAFLDSYIAFRNASLDLNQRWRSFMSDRDGAAARLKTALRGAGVNRGAALYALSNMTADELSQYFSELVYLASYEHGSIQTPREMIRSLPRKWVLANIEHEAEPLLARGEYDTWRRLLELYYQLDPALTRRLASRAAAHTDSDVREAGEDFLEKLD